MMLGSVRRLRELVCCGSALVMWGFPAHAQPIIYEDTILLDPNGSDSDGFGHAIVADDVRIYISAVASDIAGENRGSVLVYPRNLDGPPDRMLPPDGATGRVMGKSLALNNEYLAVATSPQNGVGEGEVLLYNRSDLSLVARLRPDDISSDDGFAHTIVMNDQYMAAVNLYTSSGGFVGDVFVYSLVDLSIVAILELPDGYQSEGWFGFDMAINDNLLAISDRGVSNYTGAVFLYSLTGLASDLNPLHVFQAQDASTHGAYGGSISMNDSMIAIGATEAHMPPGQQLPGGSVFVYELSTYSEIYRTNGTSADLYGQKVELNGELMAISVPMQNFNDADPMVELHRVDNFSLVAQIQASGYQPPVQFGMQTIALLDDHLLVNGWSSYGPGSRGSVFVYEGIDCWHQLALADLTGDNQLDFFDISGFLTYYQLGNLTVDFTGDGNLDFFDVSAFLNAFNAGCG